MKFGQYELLELIAVGGMSEVFKGRVAGAEGFEKYVAIKRILPDLAEDERFVKMLLTEARIHSALSHRNIVQIHDLGISEDGEYFIVLEYVEGYDLRVITEQLAAEREIVPEALSLYIASELAQGLHFAHELRGPDGQPLGLVHRDVTPSNVLISMAGEVKLSDFGLAKRRHDRSVVGSLKGNLAYMSPEQAMQAPLDRRTDVFSLGAVLFELLTGRRLREITDEAASWSQVAAGVVPSVRLFRPDLPPAIGRLLDRALAADSAQRFPDAASFAVATRAALDQINVPVGSSDLGALVAAINPPRRPRDIMMERSKVIRLGPEAQALREMIAAPPTPGIVAVSGSGRRSAGRPDATVDPDATPAPGAITTRFDDPMATPPPVAPLPAAAPSSSRARDRTPVPPRTSLPIPVPAAGGRDSGSKKMRPTGTPPSGTRRPSALSSTAGVPSLPAARAPTGRTRHETARVPLRPRGRRRGALLAAGVVAVGAAVVIHLFVVPLDVLMTWRTQVGMSIVTEPEGATLKIDDVPLPGATPVTVWVRRDRADHLVEAARPGYYTARGIIRYDKSLALSFALALSRQPAISRPPAARGGAARHAPVTPGLSR